MIFAYMLRSMTRADGSFKGMKFTWEWIVDIVLTMLIMCSAILYLNNFFEGNQVWCLPSIGATDMLDTYEMLFVASYCKLQSDISLLIYFPYFSCGSVLLISMAHYFWKEIPWIQSKINLFCTLCLEVLKLDQVFYEGDSLNRGLLRKFQFNDRQRNLVKYIQVKMMHFLLEKSSLNKYYTYKTILSSLLCVGFITLITFVMTKITFFQSTFYCNISSLNYTKFGGDFTCDISSSLPTYGIMIFHVLLLTIILVISLKALWDHYKHPYSLRTMNCVGMMDEFKSYPGFMDILFMLSLIQNNVYDGGLLLANFIKVMNVKDENPFFNYKKYGKDKTQSKPITALSDAPINMNVFKGIVHIDEVESSHIINASNLKHMYLTLFKEFMFVGYSIDTTNRDDINDNVWSLVYCLKQIQNQIEPFIMFDEYSTLVERIHQEIISKKEYFLLYTNCLRIEKYGLDPLSYQQWYRIIISFDCVVNLCYYVVVAAFSNVYHVAINVISLEESEKYVVDIITPNSSNTKTNAYHRFYIAKAQHIYFVLRKITPIIDITNSSYCNVNYDTIFDTNYDDKNELERNIIKNLLVKYNKIKKHLTKEYIDKKRTLYRNRRRKNQSIFVTFD